MWVRLRRGWPDILRQGTGGVLGWAVSRNCRRIAAGSGWNGLRGNRARSGKLIFVLVSLGTLIGTIGAFGVSFGMVEPPT